MSFDVSLFATSFKKPTISRTAVSIFFFVSFQLFFTGMKTFFSGQVYKNLQT